MSTRIEPEASAKSNALRIAQVTAKQAVREQNEWTRRRNEAIAIASKEGASLREIGGATGLSHVGIKKILDQLAASAKAGETAASSDAE